MTYLLKSPATRIFDPVVVVATLPLRHAVRETLCAAGIVVLLVPLVAEARDTSVSDQEAGFVDAYRTANPTTPGLTTWQRVDGDEPTVFRRVDYVFVVPGREVKTRVRAGRVVLNTPSRETDGTMLWPSDHYGVLVELDLAPLAAGARRAPAP